MEVTAGGGGGGGGGGSGGVGACVGAPSEHVDPPPDGAESAEALRELSRSVAARKEGGRTVDVQGAEVLADSLDAGSCAERESAAMYSRLTDPPLLLRRHADEGVEGHVDERLWQPLRAAEGHIVRTLERISGRRRSEQVGLGERL